MIASIANVALFDTYNIPLQYALDNTTCYVVKIIIDLK